MEEGKGTAVASRTPFVCCPECDEEFAKVEDLSPHLERHRPVDGPTYTVRGKLRSVQCPKGCGRWFRRRDRHHRVKELAEHLRLCDGSPPLTPQRRGSAMPKWRCEEHDYRTDNKFAWGQHKRHHHQGKEPGGAPPPEPAVVAPEEPARGAAGNSSIDDAIEELRAKKERLEEQASTIDECIEMLKKVR